MKKALLLILLAACILTGCVGKENKNPAPADNNGNAPPSLPASLTDTMAANVFGKAVKDGEIPLTKEIRQFFYEYAVRHDYRYLPVVQEGRFAHFNQALLYAFCRKTDYTEMMMSTAFVDSILQSDFPGVAYEHQTPKDGLFTFKDTVYTPVGFDLNGFATFAITKLERQTESAGKTVVFTARFKQYDFWEMDGYAGEKAEIYSKNAQYIYRRIGETAFQGLSFYDAVKKVVVDGEAAQMPHCLADMTIRFTVSFDNAGKDYQSQYLNVEQTYYE